MSKSKNKRVYKHLKLALGRTGVLLGLVIVALSACDRPAGINTLSGEFISLADLRGRWVLVNYWAEWCKPCVAEIPELNQFARANAEQVLVLGVNFDGVSGQTLEAQTKKMGINFAVVTEDPADLLGLSRPEVLPATIVLNQHGQYHTVLLGPQTSASLAAALPVSR